MGSMKDDKDNLEAISPVNLVDNIEAPVLLIHAKGDGIVYFEQMEFMQAALEKAGKDVEVLELPREGHSGWSVTTHVTYLEEIEAFLGEHLK